MGEKFKFDVVIGNPPYQEETDSKSTRMPPIYNYFMEQAYIIGKKVELITPARFLFDAGYTPSAWNKKMLEDKHLKVVYYESESGNVFSNTDIKGGIAVTYRDADEEFGPIGVFTKFPILNDILYKVQQRNPVSMSKIISAPLSYQLTDKMKKDHPNLVDRLRTNAFDALSDIFFEEQPLNDNQYIQMIGLSHMKRVRRYVKKEYIRDISGSLDTWKVLLPEANGAGRFGEILASCMVVEPGVGYTQTFIGIGQFHSKTEADNLSKYIKAKFTRAMLGVLKITQHSPGPKWKMVPQQNFTNTSDIEWSKSIAEIDSQLYAKYKLSQEEIDFIESHVKEMD